MVLEIVLLIVGAIIFSFGLIIRIARDKTLRAKTIRNIECCSYGHEVNNELSSPEEEDHFVHLHGRRTRRQVYCYPKKCPYIMAMLPLIENKSISQTEIIGLVVAMIGLLTSILNLFKELKT